MKELTGPIRKTPTREVVEIAPKLRYRKVYKDSLCVIEIGDDPLDEARDVTPKCVREIPS